MALILNGRLPGGLLGRVPGMAQQVRLDLVEQTGDLCRAFEAHFDKPLVMTDSYRPYAVQERIFRQRYTTERVTGIDPRQWLGQTWWRLPGTASASTPGRSNHGLGQAIDFSSRVNVGGSREQLWMQANAPWFGWVWPAVFRRSPYYEPWHYEAKTAVPVSAYRPFLVRLGVPGFDDDTPTVRPTPIQPIPRREDEPMDDLIRALFNVEQGREPAADEVHRWVILATEQEWSRKRLATEFRKAPAEHGAVRRAYSDLLGREADDAEVAAWLTRRLSIADLRREVGTSPEAKSRQ